MDKDIWKDKIFLKARLKEIDYALNNIFFKDIIDKLNNEKEFITERLQELKNGGKVNE